MKSLASVDLSRIMQSENPGRSCFHFSIHADFVCCGFYFGSYLWARAPSFFPCFDLGKVLTLSSIFSHFSFLSKQAARHSVQPSTQLPQSLLQAATSGKLLELENHIIAVEMMDIVAVCLAVGFVCIAHLIPVTALFGQ